MRSLTLVCSGCEADRPPPHSITFSKRKAGIMKKVRERGRKLRPFADPS